MLDYVIIGLLVVVIVLCIIAIVKNVNESKITERLGNLETNTVKELSNFQIDIMKTMNDNFNGLNERMEKKLDQINNKVNERLDDNFAKTNKTFTNILERLSRIDEAQKKIDTLSTDIVSLQSILTDKKSRGIFGEINLKHILVSIFGEKNDNVYRLQYTLPNGTIADSVIFAPEPLGTVAIDSKFPLEHYQRMVDKNLPQVDRNIAGLIANKFMAKYQRPCCILTRVEENENYTLNVSYQGSARGCDKVGITEFKDICAATGKTMYEVGHQGAFGLGIEEKNIDDFISSTNEILKDMSEEPLYYVDYIYNGNEVNPQNILDIAEMGCYWGKDVDESLIAIKDLKVTKDMVTLMSPDKTPTLKIVLPNKVSIIKFGSSQEEYDKIATDGFIKMNIIGKCNKNEWNGWVNAQIMLEDYEIVDSCKYFF